MGKSTLRDFLVSAFFIIGTQCSFFAQCPGIPDSDGGDHMNFKCEGDQIVFSATGLNLPIGSQIDWYLTNVGTQNPYLGTSTLIGEANVVGDPCANQPEVLYIMVNPDNGQVGGSGDQCDEFLVLWTGSGGYSTNDIVVSNLGPGNFVWDGYLAGNASTFSCGSALPPGPVPPNAILIIQGSPDNNVPVDIDNLCATGLPVYIIAYDGTAACTGGYFDNNSPCSSCPVMIDIDGATCDYEIEIHYMPPGSSVDGWGWGNLGSGVYADVVPVVEVPDFILDTEVEDFVWTIPDDFCEVYDTDANFVVGIPDPPPPAGCPQITSTYFGIGVICSILGLTGDIVCAGNCPDAPNEVSFQVTDDITDIIVDLEITSSLFPPFAINDLEVTDGSSLIICMEGVIPAFDAATNTLTLPSDLAGLSVEVNVTSAISIQGCMVTLDPGNLTLQLIESAEVDAGADQTICAGDAVMLDGTFSGSTFSTTWTSSGDGIFSDPGSPVSLYTPGPNDLANGSVILFFAGVDENEACFPVTDQIEITIDPSVSIDPGPPLTICNTDVANLIANISLPDVDGMWETTGDGTFDDPQDPVTFYEPGNNDILDGSVTVQFIPTDPDLCVLSNIPLDIDIVPAPEVSIPADLELCNDEILTLMISVTGNFTNIMWSAAGDGELNVINSMEVTYMPGPQDIIDQYTTVSVNVVSGFPACGQTTYNIPLNIIDCDCPPLVTIPPSGIFCLDNDTLDLSGLLSAGGPGQWSISSAPPGMNPPVIIGNELIANWSDWGNYTLTYTLDNPEPGCPFQSSEILELTAVTQPFLGPDLDICVGMPVTLSGNFVYEVPDLSLIDLHTSGDGMFQNNTGLTVEYVYGPLDAVSPQVELIYNVLDYGCGVLSDTIVITNHFPPEVEFIGDTVTICNEEDKGSVLDFTALIASGDMSGAWFNSGGALIDFSDPTSVNFDGVDEGYYVFSYQTNSASLPCMDVLLHVTIEVRECLCPLLEVQAVPDGLCSDLNAVNLNAFIMAGAPGTWSVIEAPPGGNPATFNGPVFEINNADPGDYTVRFTFNGAPLDGCPDSAEVTITLQEIPGLSIPQKDSSCWLTPVQINAGLNGSATGIQWTTTGSGQFDDPNITNPVYTPSVNDLNATSVLFIATTIDTFGYCNAFTDTLELRLVHPPTTTWSSLQTVLCNHPDSQSVINLLSYITSGDATGIWSNTDNAPVDITDPTAVDFENVSPGIYRFTYLTQTAVEPCVDSSYVFSVTIEDCGCTLMTEDISDTIFLCRGDTFILIPIVTGAVGLPFSTWISDVTLMQPTLPLFEEKTWIWIVRDFANCEERDTFTVSFLDDLDVVTEIIEPTCNGLSDGAIIIHDISGGAGPYTIKLDNLPPFTSQVPDTIADLGAGQYILEINTADGCGPVINIDVPDATVGSVNLGPDVIVPLGDSILITPVLTDINVLNAAWDPAIHTNDVNPFWLKPEESIDLMVLVTDSLGCIYEDTKRITVSEKRNIFIPNIFSPNGDQINDVLIISPSFDPEALLSLEIFDRWGNMIYRQQGNPPYQWDGISKGKEAMTGVYVVKLNGVDEEGEAFIYFSDVTLIR